MDLSHLKEGPRPPAVETAPLRWRGGCAREAARAIPEEVPVALTYDGSTYAVMMATPADLADFALGFSLSEGVADEPSDIESLDIVEVEGGVEARMWLAPAASERARRRRRSVLGPTGCGLCGVESIAAALKPARRIHSMRSVAGEDLILAMAELEAQQALHGRTRAVHAAGLWLHPSQLLVREDVGRHNALDKVLGAAAASGLPAEEGIVLLTSRVSVELVQKTARLGAPIIAAVSAPTALAVRVAQAAGITLVAIMRGDGFEVFTAPERIRSDGCASHARDY